MSGVVAWVSASDVPGVNSVTGYPTPQPPDRPYAVLEEIFATDRSHYAGQAVGLVVADTRDHAKAAARSDMCHSYSMSTKRLKTLFIN